MDLRVFSILGAGFVMGLKHALDADHLAAVSTIVGERKGILSSSIVGLFWGFGHTASLLIVGLLIVLFGFTIPEKLALALEFAVALMLVGLGSRVLWKIFRGAVFHVHTHVHEGHLHIHPHSHGSPAALHRDELEGHHHHAFRHSRKPFFVGMVHGLAGSASLMLVVLVTIPSKLVALFYIGIFGFGSVGGMLLMTTLIGIPFSLTAGHARLYAGIRTAAGVLSIVFGCFLAWEVGVLNNLFF